MTARIACVGGGISGLLTAYRLQGLGYQVTVFEASELAGGKLRTGEVGGIQVEDGADAFLLRDDVPLGVLQELGIDQTRSPAVFGAFIWHNHGLRRLPPGSPYGIPRDPSAARRAGLLGRVGRFRAEMERFNRVPLSGPDISVGRFVRSRFGTEVLTNLVDPLLAGVRGGMADEMSLAAAAKEIDGLARRNASVLAALRAQDPVPPRFVTPEGGIDRLTDALAERIHDLRLNAPVERIDVDRQGTTLVHGGNQEAFDGLVLACPPFAAGALLEAADPTVSRDLGSIAYASLAVVTLVYPPGSLTVPEGGSGFLVPTGSGLTIAACTWYSTKWPHITSDGRQVVRCVVGRAGKDENLAHDDDELATRVHHDLQITINASAPPLSQRVVRWDKAIPQYRVGHLDLIASIEDRLRGLGPIVPTGAGYRGSGIPDCIAQAESVATTMSDLVPLTRG